MKHKFPFILKKSSLLFSVLLLVISPSILQSQVVNGNMQAPHSDTVFVPDTNRNCDEIFFSVKMGVLIPQGLFAQPVSAPAGIISNYNNVFNSLTFPFKGMEGLGAKTGYNLQFEGFTALLNSSMVHAGLQYGFDFGYIPLNWSNVQWSNYNMSVGTSPFLFLGFKVGPAVYFNPSKNMGIGIYGTIDPLITAPGGEHALYTYTDASGDATTARYNLKDSSNFHINIDVSAGIDIYYKAFIFGVEYSWIHTKYTGETYENESITYKGVTTYPAAYDPFVDVIQTNVLKITMGIRLSYAHKAWKAADN